MLPSTPTLLISRVSPAGQGLVGAVDVQAWGRLREAGLEPDAVAVEVMLRRQGQVVLAEGQLQVQGQLRCERCLGFMPWSETLSLRVAMAETEAVVQRADPDRDPVLCPDGVLNWSVWLEDEVLLALPLLPRCDVWVAGPCPVSGVDVPALDWTGGTTLEMKNGGSTE